MRIHSPGLAYTPYLQVSDAMGKVAAACIMLAIVAFIISRLYKKKR